MKKLSELIPKLEGEEINVGIWDEHIPYEGKWELWEGVPFNDDGIARDKLTICLLYSMGLQHLLEILPAKSKKLLKELLREDENDTR